MEMRRGRTWLGLALLGAMVSAACGRDAESAGDEGSTRLVPPVEADAGEEVAVPEEAPAAEPAPEPVAPAPAAPAREPSRPAPRPAQQTGPVTAPPPSPVDERPETEWTLPPTTEARAVRALEAGRTLDLRMESRLSTESSRPGEEFYAVVSEDILGSGGEVLVPMGARVRGTVLESRESEGADAPASIRLEIESVTVNGAVRPVKASVVDVEMKTEARDSGTRTAAKVGAGAAAGAVVGRILGRDTRSAVKGAVAGTVAGAAVAIATQDGHATIEPGAHLVIRLDDRLIVDD